MSPGRTGRALSWLPVFLFLAFGCTCSRHQADASYLTNQGVRFYRQGRIDAALRQLEQAAALTPDFVPAHYNLGIVYAHGKGDHTNAMKHLKMATSLDPTHDDSWYQLGKCSLVLDQLDAASAAFKKTLTLNPYHAPTLYELGLLAEKMGDLVGADSYYRQVIVATPTNPHPYLALAEIYEIAGYPDEAESVFREGLRLNPHSGALHHGLGVLLIRSGRTEEGTENLREALVLDSDLIMTHFNLAVAYLRRGEINRARYQLQRFLARQGADTVRPEVLQTARDTLKRLP